MELIMTISYRLASKLYLNITNTCPCACVFCLRETQSGVGDAASLWLEREPEPEEIKAALNACYPFDGMDEIVFCGYGEPMARADVVVEICQYVKDIFAKNGRAALPIRINTNGLVYLMCPGFDASTLAAVDTVSISLNADDPAEYLRVARPRFGEQSFDALLDFARDAREYTDVVFSVVEGTMSDQRLENCMRIAQELGVSFRLRPRE